MQNFTVGSKVMYVDNMVGNTFPPKGTVGVVKEVDCEFLKVEWPEGSVERGYSRCSWIFNHRVKLMEEEPVDKSKNNGDEQLVCADCGCIIEDTDDYVELTTGEIVCADCAAHYEVCEDCGRAIEDIDDVITTADTLHTICRDCATDNHRYYECEDCGEWFDSHRTSQMETADGRTICHDCFEDSYFTCEDCGKIYPWDERYEIRGEFLCEDCANERRRDSIKGYGYKPHPVFKNSKGETKYDETEVSELLFGVELEVDDGNDCEECAEEIQDRCEDVYCKHDGSLDDGFEIVSHPCTLSYHMETLGWSAIVRKAREYSFLSHDARTCGLHVHVGRRQLGETWDERRATAAKVVMLVDRHWDAIVKFSRRRGSQLNRWATRPSFTIGFDEETTITNALETERDGRYVSVNLTNGKTIEFRVFNGTLKTRTIFATLQFVSNLCKYAMGHTVQEVLGSDWEDIVGVEEHEELRAYLKDREISPERIAKTEFRRRDNTLLKTGDLVRVTGFGVFDEKLRHVVGETFPVVSAEDDSRVLLYMGDNKASNWHSADQFSECKFYCADRENVEFVRIPKALERENFLHILRDINEGGSLEIDWFRQI